ncbi:lactate racemase domain-containing protein [Limisphaera sp. VF-2]|jgi:nickel-dependent lactate racemase|uniref:lactate racemase domain-containing protein n=1 Tax=Limisphaera sp. VF-2 TaxID=3400418 RepID=UPI00176FDF63|nr:lactate racemase domain-containing protein [Limisphaera sp.]
MLYFEAGSAEAQLTEAQLREGLFAALDRLGPRRRVLVVPPDFTRFHSQAGLLTRLVYEYYGDRLTDVLPALGTHTPMTPEQIAEMYAGVPPERFRVHNWRTGVVTVGEVPAAFVREVSEGAVDFAWPAQLARLIWEGGHDLILSIGQVVPHEVIGMASYNKNLFVGTGGAEGINKSHFIGAAYGMERMMGRADTPVRRILDYASEHFIRHLPVVYVHTVVSRDEEGGLRVRGLYISDDRSGFEKAAALSLQVNFQMLDEPLSKVVVYLDPAEFKSTWLGNKSIYRTRMAMADGGELIVLAPGLREFGEDPEIDRLIRKYGYRGTPATLRAVREQPELQANLSAAAHLIHGSSEGRFRIIYCPGHLSREEIEGVGFEYADLAAMLRRYPPDRLRDGWNTLPDGERVYFISNPALGLWAWRGRFA